MSAEEKDVYFDCSFVSIHYIICECGETFPSENGLKAHLEKEHPHKRERKEFKCGVCGSVYTSEDDCIAHYEENHIVDIKQEDDDEQDDDEDVDAKTDQHVEDEQMVMEQQELLEDEIPVDEQMMVDHLVMNEETGEFMAAPQPEPETVKVKPEWLIKTVRSGHVKPKIKPKMDKLMIKSVKPDRIVVKPQPVTVTSGNGTEEQQLLHIPEEYGQLLQVTPDGQLVIIMNNETEQADQDFSKKGRAKKLYGKHIVCEVCGKKYASNAALKYHQRVHTGEKPYKCHLCPKSFAMPLFLQIHIRTHTGERPFKCPECPKAFSNKAALLRHDRVHTGEKPYECPMCLKSFTQSNSLKLHVATVHLKQPAPYKSKNRKLMAQVRAMKNNETVEVTIDKKVDVIQENEDGEAARNIAVETQEDHMYEVIESEEIINEEKEVYTIIYED